MQQHSQSTRKQKSTTPPPSHIFSSLRRNNSHSSTSSMVGKLNDEFIPHKGALYRVESQDSYAPSYVIEIRIPSLDDDETIDFLNDRTRTRELRYSSNDYKVVSRLFAILDTENINLVSRSVVKDFVYKRCPVFSKRDDDLIRLQIHASRNDMSASSNERKERSTFDEIWESVVACSQCESNDSKEATCLGIEGWLVFCRFIALTQYLEAKRRFSARHSQRHSSLSEAIMVDVPPPLPPTPITPLQLATYEDRNDNGLPIPELDLDHSLLAAHDLTARRRSTLYDARTTGDVKIALFGATSDASSSSNLEFAVSYKRRSKVGSSIIELDEGVVRRSMNDMKWLDETFTSHRILGGTLCGRILPPFPQTSSSSNGVLSSHFQNDESSFNAASIKSSTGGAINAAAIGVSRIRDAAKSLISPLSMLMNSSPNDVRSDDIASTTSGSHNNHNQQNLKKLAKKRRSISLALPENYYNPNSPVGRARQIERYLNYLLEHPALSTSFPLNAILTASQSGLEAAREILADCVRVTKELKEQSPHFYDNKTGTPNFGWVRTVAQAAMALQVHGFLENTGMPSASARLQHASLPAFGLSARVTGCDELDISSSENYVNSNDIPHAREVLNFEDGVVNDDGFDLLPLPVPAPERRILTVGNNVNTKTKDASAEERFHYGSGNIENCYPIQLENDHGSAYLGDIAIDENIDKLREVIGSVDNTFSRCLVSSGDIGKAYQERLNLHTKVIRGLDSWEGMRGRFIGQRSLLQGVAGVEYGKEMCQDSYLALIDDLSWQTALASSAVTAAEDVRAAVRVARTASNARAAASSASLTAQAACDRGEFANLDEARAAQTRASIAQSHAIHAAVVEHEAKTVKRRATLALANDVETWNIHRKKEMLRSCIAFARSQHEVARRNVESWSTLRDGYIGASIDPSIAERKASGQAIAQTIFPTLSVEATNMVESDEVISSILNDSPEIVAVDHNMLSANKSLSAVEEENVDSYHVQTSSENDIDLYHVQTTSENDIAKSIEDVRNDMFLLPFAEAAPINVNNESDLISFDHWDNVSSSQHQRQSSSIIREQQQPQPQQEQLQHESSFTDETMGESMQSIVNSIINKWGLGFDSYDDDHLALPVGMAASILLEDDHHSLTNSNGLSFNIV